MKIALVESGGSPLNEGYKNLPDIHEVLKKGFDVEIFDKNLYDGSKLQDYEIIWLFNFPESISHVFRLLKLRRIGKVIMKEVAKNARVIT